MKIYFENDGTYSKSTIYRPITIQSAQGSIAIGFIQDIDDEKVTCQIFDNFTFTSSVGMSIDGIRDYISIGIKM